MTTSYDELRSSFDNILKELDEICKSIDDLTDFDQTISNRYNNHNRPAPSRHIDDREDHVYNRPSTGTGSDAKYSNFKSSILDRASQYRLTSLKPTANRTTTTTAAFSKIPNFLPKPTNTYNSFYTNNNNNASHKFYKFDSRIYEKYKKQFRNEPAKETAVSVSPPLQRKEENPNQKSELKSNHKSSHSKYKRTKRPTTDHDERHITSPALISMIGSAKEKAENITLNTYLNKFYTDMATTNDESLPMATTITRFNNLEIFNAHTSQPLLTLNTSSTLTSSLIKLPNQRDDEENTDNAENSLVADHNNTNEPENDDYLSSSEISKIEYFYSSMGCYVYVGRCIAELYQIKREDEFDSMDADPVNDYRRFMENKGKLTKQTANNSNDDNGGAEEKSNVNYMYINSGVPVIVFNYGSNPKRKKDLRILLAERATGFCLWEFKFDRLTQFDNLDQMTVIRLTLNQSSSFSNAAPPPPVTHLPSNSSTSQLQAFFSSMFSSAASSSSASHAPSMQYKNEYFERFFNTRNRHTHKEHLIKFVIKRDCDEFCFKLMKIMNDKRNSDLFVNEYLNNENNECVNDLKFNRNSFNYESNQSLNSINSIHSSNYTSANVNKSSVIICHFDFFNYNFNNNNNNKIVPSSANVNYSLGKKSSFSSLGSLEPLDNVTKPSSSYRRHGRLVKQYSNSSANMAAAGAANGEVSSLASDSYAAGDKSKSSVEFKNLTGSVINLEESGATRNSITTSAKIKNLLVKYKKLKKSDISSPVNFSHVTHLDKPVPIGKRYKFDY